MNHVSRDPLRRLPERQRIARTVHVPLLTVFESSGVLRSMYFLTKKRIKLVRENLSADFNVAGYQAEQGDSSTFNDRSSNIHDDHTEVGHMIMLPNDSKQKLQ